MPLNTEEMINVGEQFKRALEHTLGNLIGETKLRAAEFVYHIALQTKPYLMLTNSSVTDLTDKVFQSEEIRDFVLATMYSFYSFMGGGSLQHINLANTLAESAGSNPASVIPKPVLDRMVTTNEASNTLQANKWLVVLMLIPLFVEIPEEYAKELANGA